MSLEEECHSCAKHIPLNDWVYGGRGVCPCIGEPLLLGRLPGYWPLQRGKAREKAGVGRPQSWHPVLALLPALGSGTSFQSPSSPLSHEG